MFNSFKETPTKKLHSPAENSHNFQTHFSAASPNFIDNTPNQHSNGQTPRKLANEYAS